MISSLLTHAARHHAEKEIVSRRVEGDIHRYTYRDGARARLANALHALGVEPATASARSPGTATATWSSTSRCPARARCCTPSIRGCTRTRSPRSPTMPRTSFLFFDLTFCRWSSSRPRTARRSRRFVADDRPRAHAGARELPNLLCYEDLLDGADRRLRLAGVRRAPGLQPVLHLRHHRQPQGRAVQPPLHGAARLRPRPCPTRSTCRRATWSCRWCRCSMSTPGACRMRRRMVGAKLVLPGPRWTAQRCTS